MRTAAPKRMNLEHPVLQNALAAALASTPAMVAVVWALWQHNRRLADLRDIVRAEIKAAVAELRLEIQENRTETRESFGEIKLMIERLDHRVQRLEEGSGALIRP